MLYPLAGYIIVTGEAPPETSFGFIVEESGKKLPERGTVVTVGKNVEDITPGDKVIFKKYAPDEIEVTDDGEKKRYLVINHEDIIAIIK